MIVCLEMWCFYLLGVIKFVFLQFIFRAVGRWLTEVNIYLFSRSQHFVCTHAANSWGGILWCHKHRIFSPVTCSRAVPWAFPAPSTEPKYSDRAFRSSFHFFPGGGKTALFLGNFIPSLYYAIFVWLTVHWFIFYGVFCAVPSCWTFSWINLDVKRSQALFDKRMIKHLNAAAVFIGPGVSVTHNVSLNHNWSVQVCFYWGFWPRLPSGGGLLHRQKTRSHLSDTLIPAVPVVNPLKASTGSLLDPCSPSHLLSGRCNKHGTVLHTGSPAALIHPPGPILVVQSWFPPVHMLTHWKPILVVKLAPCRWRRCVTSLNKLRKVYLYSTFHRNDHKVFYSKNR